MLKKTGRLLHESSAAHAAALGKTLDKYEVDEKAMKEFLPPSRATTPSCIVHEDSPPTRVMKMNVEDGLLDSIKRELELRSKLDAAIAKMGAERIKSFPEAQQYSPLSTQFENAVFFLPSAQRFYQLNRDLIQSTFPEIQTSVVNAFVVAPNQRPYGVHNAASIGLQVPALAQRGVAYPKTYVSFHTAVTPTPLDRQPLAIFEDATTESPNTSFAYDFIKACDLEPEEAAAVDKAFYLHDANKLSEFDLPSIGHYLLCKYYEKKYSAQPDKAAGYYGECKPGDAVVFDNYRPHGDSTLPLSPEPRITIDVRCFSKVDYPSERVLGGIDFILNPDRKRLMRERKKAAIECLVLLMGWDNYDQFVKHTYGHEDVDPFDITTDLQFSVYNKTEHYILNQNLEPHFDRCRKTYDCIERDGEYVIPDKAQEAIANLYS